MLNKNKVVFLYSSIFFVVKMMSFHLRECGKGVPAGDTG
jgi:hypothetical protein